MFLLYFYLSFIYSFAENPKHINEGFEALTFEEPNGKYIDKNYLDTHVIPKSDFTYSSTGDKISINNAFDGKNTTFWLSDQPENETFKPAVFINFTQPVLLEAFLYDLCFGTDKTVNPPTRRFDAFPKRFKIYTALDDEPFVLNSVFTGTLISHYHQLQYVFSKPILCSRLKLEYTDVTPAISFREERTLAGSAEFTFIKDLGYDLITYRGVTGNYALSNYIKFHQISKDDFHYSSNGDKLDISNAFDDKIDTYWVSANPETDTFKPSIFVNFTKPLLLEAFLFDTAFSTNNGVNPPTRRYDGLAQELKVYISTDDDHFELKYVFTGNLSYPDSRVECVFPSPVRCSKIKLEFTKVTPAQSLGTTEKCAGLGGLTFLKSFNDEAVTYEGLSGKYEDSYYYSTHFIPFNEMKYESTGDREGFELKNLFDDTKDTYWISSKENSDDFKAKITIRLNNPTLLEAIIFFAAYRSSGTSRTFDGFPTMLKVYTALNDDDELVFNTLFVGTPVYPWEKIQFVLPNPVNCTRIQLEFVDVTPENSFSGGSITACLSGIFLMKALSYDFLEFEGVKGCYYDTLYINSHKLSTTEFNYSSNGDLNDHPPSYAFDDSKDTTWVSSITNSDTEHAILTANFHEPVLLEAILIDPGFKTESATSRIFSGFPTKLLISTSLNNQPLLPKALFQGETSYNNIRYQFVFKNPIPCSKLQMEFIDVTNEVVFSGSKKVASLTGLMLICSQIEDNSGSEVKGPLSPIRVNESYVKNQITDSRFIDYDLPKDEDYLYIVEKEFIFDNVTFSCPQGKISAIKSTLSPLVSIKNCTFDCLSVKSADGNGGAVNVANCAVNMGKSDFINCSSSNGGGGGGIYAIIDQPIEDSFIINDCTFESCSASYGGGIYLYSSVESASISILKCLFKSNSLSSTSSSKDLVGGSAIYLDVVSANVEMCKFSNNKGQGSIKITNSNQNEYNSKRLLGKSSFSIKNCLFEIDYESSSISLINNNPKSFVFVDGCIFFGELSKDSYHIESTSSLMRLNGCKFSCDKEKALKIDSSLKIDSFNLEKQEFNFKFVDTDLENIKSSNNENRNVNSTLLLVSLAIMAVVALVATLSAFIILKKKQKENSEEIDNNEPLTSFSE